MMDTTYDLLKTALAKQPASAWSRIYKVQPSTFTNAKNIKRLSPILAGNLAIDLGEEPQRWMAIAAMEAERNSPMKTRLNEKMGRCKPSP